MSDAHRLLNEMLERFDAEYGVHVERAIIVSSHLSRALVTSHSSSPDRTKPLTVVPSGWYRGFPVDAVSHGHDWLIAIVGERAADRFSCALYGDTRTGAISRTVPALGP